jgi:hypothetical protein
MPTLFTELAQGFTRDVAQPIGGGLNDLINRWKQGIETEATWFDPKAKGPGKAASTGPTDPTKTKAAKSKSAEEKAKAEAKAQEKAWKKAIEASPFTKLMDVAGQQYKGAEKAAQSMASGATGQAATTGAFTQALQELAKTPATIGETPGQWLSQNLAVGQQVTAPLTAAMAAYGKAQGAAQGPINAALSAMGQGEALGLMTAPTDAWLNALASHVLSNMGYYGEVPTAISGSLPSSIGTAIKEYGGEAGTTATVPATELTTRGPYALIPRSKTGKVDITTSASGVTPSVPSIPTAPSPG